MQTNTQHNWRLLLLPPTLTKPLLHFFVCLCVFYSKSEHPVAMYEAGNGGVRQERVNNVGNRKEFEVGQNEAM